MKGKFASIHDEAVYNLAQDGEWIGSDEFGLSATLLEVPHDQPIAGLVVARGAFVVTEDDQGFVSVSWFADLRDARTVLNGIEAEYADWYLPETAPGYAEA